MDNVFVKFIFYCYALLFAKKSLYKFNKILFELSLRGFGIHNFANDRISGERCFFRKVLTGKHNLLVMDVGANKGQYSNKIRACCPDAVIYAFEPHPRTFRLLQAEATLHDYEAIDLGLSSETGSMQLYDRQTNTDGTQHASLYREVIEDIHQMAAASFEVEITTIDTFVAERGIRRIDLLKIDTEGNELKVLQGAQKTLAGNVIDMIQIEFNEMNTVSRVFFKDFLALLNNYDCYRLLPSGLLPVKDYRPLLCELFAFQNVLFIRRGSRFTL